MPSQHRTAATLVPANGVELEVIIEGTGEPVLLIQTALLAEEFAPLTREPALRDRYQLIRYHRRGYGGSSPVHGPGSIERDAADCRALMTALRTGPAHVVGLSYSGPIALRLAVDAADLVHSLTLLEPPPMHTPSEPQFRAACATLVEDYHLRGPADAVNTFLSDVIGPNWRTAAADTIPETPDRLIQDMATFIGTDIPALLAWTFSSQDANHINQPVLHIGGSDSGPWFADVRRLMLTWLPHADDVVLPGANHSFAITHPHELATALAQFLRRHPIQHLRERAAGPGPVAPTHPVLIDPGTQPATDPANPEV